jgi:hypothetical protein
MDSIYRNMLCNFRLLLICDYKPLSQTRLIMSIRHRHPIPKSWL